MNTLVSFDQQYTVTFAGKFVYETMDSVLALWQTLKPSLSQLPKLNLSCSQIEVIDSSFMAFIIEIKRFCNEHGIRVELVGLSAEKTDFLSAYGVMDIIKES